MVIVFVAVEFLFFFPKHFLWWLFQDILSYSVQVVLLVKNLLIKAGDTRDVGFDPWVGKIPGSRKWQPIPVFLPGPRDLAGYSLWDRSQTWPSMHARTHTRTHAHTHTRTHLRILISGNSNGWLLEESELPPSFSIEIFMKMHICMQHP